MLSLAGITKSFPARGGGESVTAVRDISLDVEKGSLFALLGPSGCGKTTLLQCIAGLETPDAGTIRVGGNTVFDGASKLVVPANRRGLGMVFQSYAIWPHMTVFDNVAFPLQVRKRGQRPGKKEITDRVTKVLETMELGHVADRQATKLSGGQQQRLALARAIVIRPWATSWLARWASPIEAVAFAAISTRWAWVSWNAARGRPNWRRCRA